MTNELRGKHVLVMGLGINAGGVGVARFLAQQGALVTATDLRGPDILRPSLEALSDLPIQLRARRTSRRGLSPRRTS